MKFNEEQLEKGINSFESKLFEKAMMSNVAFEFVNDSFFK